MSTQGITRRRALEYLVALGSLPLVRCGGESVPSEIVALRRDRHSAELLGRTWLAAQQPAPAVAELLERVCGASDCAAFHDDPERLRSRIGERHRSDFQSGDLELLEGWLLTRTEVALYALVALGE